MNIFGLITIGLVATAVLLIYYVEIPRLRREVKNQGWYLEHTERTISSLISDVDMIKSARGTFSRQLAELTGEVDKNITSLRQEDVSLNRRMEQIYRLFGTLESLVHSIGDKVDNETFFRRKLGDKLDIYSTAMNNNFIAIQGYLDSMKPKEPKKSEKAKKSGK
jgi:hypothetical protein